MILNAKCDRIYIIWCAFFSYDYSLPIFDNWTSHPYHLYESILMSRAIRSNFSLFDEMYDLANRMPPDGKPYFEPSHLGLFCLPISHKKTPVV